MNKNPLSHHHLSPQTVSLSSAPNYISLLRNDYWIKIMKTAGEQVHACMRVSACVCPYSKQGNCHFNHTT